jgi:hypothetical protein
MKCCVTRGGKQLMNLSARSKIAAVIATWVLLPLAAVSQHPELTIKHGLYVREPEPCKDAPNASIIQWDGVGFFGPHSSKCKSTVTFNHGNQYEIRTSCSALGDGSANPSGTPFVELFTLTSLSSSEFTIAKRNKRQGNYRWCGAQ